MDGSLPGRSPAFRSQLRMRPVSRRHSRRGLVGGSTFRRTPISRSPPDKNPMPGQLSELHPVNEVNTKGQFFRASVGKNPRFHIPDDPNLKAYIIKETHRIREISKGLRKHKALYRVNKAQERLDV